MTAPSIRFRPTLFGAAGAGFQNDATVNDGVHLRWSLDPRLGLPGANNNSRFNVFFLRTKERTLENVDLFQPSSSNYPVHSNRVDLGHGQSSVFRNAGSLWFARPIDFAAWEPLFRYLFRRPLLDALVPGIDANPLVAYMDSVMRELNPRRRGDGFMEEEDVVAVDIRFRSSGQIPPVTPPTRPIRGNQPTPGILLDRFRHQAFIHVRGYDYCDRLIAEDWVGRRARRTLRHRRLGPVAATNPLKLTARLRAPGITRVEIAPVSGQPGLVEDEVRWIFCDEFASAEQLWVQLESYAFQPTGAAVSPQVIEEEVYAPFRVGTLDWVDLAHRIEQHFLHDPALMEMLQASDTFAMFEFTTDVGNGGAATPDESFMLPLLGALNIATADPVIASLFSYYGYTSKSDLSGRDWKVEINAPFFDDANLDGLDGRLVELSGFSPEFFHTSNDAFSGLDLAGLVLNAEVGPKPPPPKPEPIATANSQLLPVEVDEFNLFVSAAVEVGEPQIETRPYRVNQAYEITRLLTDEAPENVVESPEGPLDDIGILPDVVLPRLNEETCLAETVLSDTFSRLASKVRKLSYLVRGYDLFGRPSELGETAPIELIPPCQPPPSPAHTTSQIVASGDALAITFDFSLGRDTTPVEAAWDDLEILVYKLPAIDNAVPANTTWTGDEPARLLTIPFDTTDQTLRIDAVAGSCQLLSWSGATLTRVPTVESACGVLFGPATLEEIAAANIIGDDRGMYRLSLPLGSKTQYGADLHAWCARVRVKGICPFTGNTEYSEEICARATYRITEPPPNPVQPAIGKLPLSTYPDRFGDSYYGIDLRTTFRAADLVARPLVKIFLARLGRLTNDPALFVDGDTIIDPPGLRDLARASKLKFELLTDPPNVYDPRQPRYDARVPGSQREVYVVAVIGSNVYLEESRWEDAAFFAFQTPSRKNAPNLRWLTAEPARQDATLTSAHTWVAEFDAPLPDPIQAPRLQVLRQDLSTREPFPIYLDTIDGTPTDSAPGSLSFSFAFVDESLEDWRRYRYLGHLLEYRPDRARHVKINPPAERELGAPWGGVRAALDASDPMTVSEAAGGGFVIEVEFAAGEFDFTLTKLGDDGQQRVIRGRINRGRVLASGANVALEVGARMTLRFEDADSAPGTYIFRLAFGQARVWSRQVDTP